MRSFWLCDVIAICILLTLTSQLSATPVTAPYFIDFHQFPTGPNTIPTLTPSDVQISSSGTMDVAATQFNPYNSKYLQITNLAGRDFEISTDFTFSGTGGVHLVAASGGAGLGGGYYDLHCILGTLMFYNGDQFTSCAAGGRLTLRGHVHDGLIDLIGTNTVGNGSTSLTYYNQPLATGEYYGVAIGLFSPRETIPVGHFSNIKVVDAVPEPATLLLAAVSVWSVGRRRRS
jgi:hypothetical protein